MLNLSNVQKAVNDGNLQVLRGMEKFDNLYERIWTTKTYNPENIAMLNELMQALNVDGYSIYQSTGNVINDARELYFGTLKVLRGTHE
jgi:hypothetical protein